MLIDARARWRPDCFSQNSLVRQAFGARKTDEQRGAALLDRTVR